MRRSLLHASWFMVIMTCGLTPAYAQKDLKILSVSYDQHFNPAESVTFSILVKNNETSDESAEVDVTLTNLATRAETTLTPVIIDTVAAGGTLTLSSSYTVAEGNYSVSFPLFDGNGDKTDQISGKFPLNIGTETESIRVFPEVLHLGSIPPGRFMHPTPIEISWNFFRFNRLRLDTPFVIRLYTDNAARYHGIPGALRRSSSAGLVSMDGRYVIPMKVWNLNYGPDIQETGWDASLAGPPPVEEDDFWMGPVIMDEEPFSFGPASIQRKRNLGSASWIRMKDRVELSASPFGWTRGEGLIGQDPHDVRYVTEKNVTGDFTLASPFTVYLATDAGPTAVEGAYSATLIVELWSP